MEYNINFVVMSFTTYREVPGVAQFMGSGLNDH